MNASRRTWPGAGEPAPGALWALVLAGGEGARLRRLTRLICGDDRPKQYVPLVGPATLLAQTLTRVARLVPAERTVIVGQEQQSGYLAAERGIAPGTTVLLQPEDRGTAAAILLGAHWIQARDPGASVAVFPSDHFVLQEDLFGACVLAALAWSRRTAGEPVLLGARPTEPDAQYGWIEPGAVLDVAEGRVVRRVRRFREKPSAAAARACFQAGGLWNTLVFVAGVGALTALGRLALPALDERLRRAGHFAGSEHESWALRQAYAHAPGADFSRAVLERLPPRLAVLEMPALFWTDLGTPERVVATMRALGMVTPWLTALERSA